MFDQTASGGGPSGGDSMDVARSGVTAKNRGETGREASIETNGEAHVVEGDVDPASGEGTVPARVDGHGE